MTSDQEQSDKSAKARVKFICTMDPAECLRRQIEAFDIILRFGRERRRRREAEQK